MYFYFRSNVVSFNNNRRREKEKEILKKYLVFIKTLPFILILQYILNKNHFLRNLYAFKSRDHLFSYVVDRIVHYYYMVMFEATICDIFLYQKKKKKIKFLIEFHSSKIRLFYFLLIFMNDRFQFRWYSFLQKPPSLKKKTISVILCTFFGILIWLTDIQ